MFRSTIISRVTPEAESFPFRCDIHKNYGIYTARMNKAIRKRRYDVENNITEPPKEGETCPALIWLDAMCANLDRPTLKFMLSPPNLQGLRLAPDSKEDFNIFEFAHGQGLSPFEIIYLSEMFSGLMQEAIKRIGPGQHPIEVLIPGMIETAKECTYAAALLKYIFPPKLNRAKDLVDRAVSLRKKLSQGQIRDDSTKRSAQTTQGSTKETGSKKSQQGSDKKKRDKENDGAQDTQKNTSGPYNFVDWLIMVILDHGYDPSLLYQAVKEKLGEQAAEERMKPVYTVLVPHQISGASNKFEMIPSMNIPLGESKTRWLMLRRIPKEWDSSGSGHMTGVVSCIDISLPMGDGKPSEPLYAGYALHVSDTATARKPEKQPPTGGKTSEKVGKISMHGHFVIFPRLAHKLMFVMSPQEFDAVKKLEKYVENNGNRHFTIEYFEDQEQAEFAVDAKIKSKF